MQFTKIVDVMDGKYISLLDEYACKTILNGITICQVKLKYIKRKLTICYIAAPSSNVQDLSNKFQSYTIRGSRGGSKNELN